MRPVLSWAAGMVAIVAAAPAPQDIDFDLIYALPNPTYSVASDQTAQTVTYTPSLIYAEALPQITSTETGEPVITTAPPQVTATETDDSVIIDAPSKRAAACAALPTGAGPVANPDTPANFFAVPDFARNANTASTPSGYTQVFKNLNASNSAYGYLGYTTYKAYDVASCAAKCNSISGCVSFNTYYERGPSVEPGSGDSGCTNPSSTTFIKCAFWGGPVTAANANNYGQWRNKFQVVIAGSNGYVSNAIPSIPGYGSVIPLGKAAINAPYDVNGFESYMGVAIFTAGPFNASLCAQACSDKSAYARAHPPTDGSPIQTCQFFNTYIIYINSTSNPNSMQGQYCAMYSENWSKSYATNVGQKRGNDNFLIQYSFAYSNATDPGAVHVGAAIHQASRDISNSTLQPFCSSYLGYPVPVSVRGAVDRTYIYSYTGEFTKTTTTYITTTPATTTTDDTYAKRREEPVITIAPEILALKQRDDLTTPDVLTKYPASVLSPACSLQATSGPATVTYTSTATVIFRTSLAIETEVVTEPVANECMWFKLRISAPDTVLDSSFLTTQVETEVPGPIIIPSYMYPYYYLGGGIELNRYRLDAASGFLVTLSGGNLFGIWLGGLIRSGNLTSIGLATFDPYWQQYYNGPVPWSPSRCAIDANTREVTCTNTGLPDQRQTTFYIDNTPNPRRVLMGVTNPYPGGPKLYVPVKLYAHCTVPELSDGVSPCQNCYNNLA